MTGRILRSPLAPWAGMLAGPVAWLINHQGVADAVYFHCPAGNPVTSLIVGVACLVILVVAGIVSWRARASGAGTTPEPQSRWFISLLSVLLCALFAVTVLLQTLAGLILPGCYR